MNNTIIGIDPGKGGAFAWVEKDEYFAVNMPDTPGDIAVLVEDILMLSVEPMAYLEKVHSMPRDGVASAFKFGYNTGVLRGVLATCGAPLIEVTPQKWQKGMGLPVKPAMETRASEPAAAARIAAQHKAVRKRAIKEQMQARYPKLKVTLKTADALAIMTWAINGGKW